MANGGLRLDDEAQIHAELSRQEHSESHGIAHFLGAKLELELASDLDAKVSWGVHLTCVDRVGAGLTRTERCEHTPS